LLGLGSRGADLARRGAQFAIYPLELVRTRLAVCPAGHYRGIFDCFSRVLREEGHRAFYRGLTPSLARALAAPPPPAWACTCADACMRALRCRQSHVHAQQYPAVSRTIYARYRLALRIIFQWPLRSSSHASAGTTALVSAGCRLRGPLLHCRSRVRARRAAQIGILPYAGVDIATFELLKEHLLDVHDGAPPPYTILGAGMLSSTIAQFVSYPLALTRTRLQARRAAPRRFSLPQNPAMPAAPAGAARACTALTAYGEGRVR
jgi:hypothetical protein